MAAASPCPYYSLVRCPVCGHIAVSEVEPRVRNPQLQAQYFGEAFAQRSGAFITFYESINSRRLIPALRLAPHSKVLEVGPGSGSVMADLAAQGHEVIGLDLSQAVASEIGKRLGLRVFVQTLAKHAADNCSECYDAIVMRHVLEHFAEPCAALRDTFGLLKAGGQLYVAVPNMAAWHSRWRGWSGYAPYHLHYFGPESLSAALRRAGFQLTHQSSYESLTGWPNTLFRSIHRKGCDAETNFSAFESGSWSVARNALEIARLALGLVLSPLRWLQSALGRGEELVVIALKPRS